MYNVVFVDDEEHLTEIYEELFSLSNVKVNCFTDTDEAGAFINSHSVSLVVIDYRMPKISGIEFRKKISSDIPCLLVTGEFVKESVDGFVDVVEKPLTEDVFDVVLKKYGISYGKEELDTDPYKALFNHTDKEVHIWKVVRDPSGNIKTWELYNANPKALKAWNRKLEDIIGKSTEEIFPDSSPVELFMPVVEEIFQENHPVSWKKFFPGTKQVLEMISVPCGDYFISMETKLPEELIP